MCQQTQIATVLPYYERWMQRFPTVQDLAKATDQEVLQSWQGLGYYRRPKLLLSGARFVSDRGWPKSAKDWKRVPGVGPYTAGAIASIAFNEPASVVDGNVARVFARLTHSDLSGNKLIQAAWKWADTIVDEKDPGDWNQALMELGATICTPDNPKCEQCPLKEVCMGSNAGKQITLPIPAPKPSAVAVDYIVYVTRCGAQYGVRQIPNGQWWAGMWEFPRYPSGQLPDFEVERFVDLGIIKHTVTNHKLSMQIVLAEMGATDPSMEWWTRESLEHIAMPAPQRKILKLLDDSKLLAPA
jgi:A/G-specific adenine glycosylase